MLQHIKTYKINTFTFIRVSPYIVLQISQHQRAIELLDAGPCGAIQRLGSGVKNCCVLLLFLYHAPLMPRAYDLAFEEVALSGIYSQELLTLNINHSI